MYTSNSQSIVGTPILQSSTGSINVVVNKDVNFYYTELNGETKYIKCKYCQQNWKTLTVTTRKAHLSINIMQVNLNLNYV